MTIAITLLLFIVVLFFLIICHEFGHFMASRRAGIKVEEFGIGFPPRLLSMKRGDTEYSLNLIPLGAFVRPAGESDPNVPDGLAGKGPWTRMGVYAAGPLVNVFMAFVFLSAFFLVPVETIRGEGVMIHHVSSESPAAEAGIMPGDVMLEIDGREILQWGDIQQAINSDPEKEKSILIGRNSERLNTTLTPQFNPDYNRYLIGVTLCWGMVTEVEAGSPGYDAGIMPGDTILGVNKDVVYSGESLNEALNSIEPGTDAKVTLLRVGEILEKTMTVGPNIGIESKWVNDVSLEKQSVPLWTAMWRSGDFMVHIPYYIKESIPLIRQDPSMAVVGPIGAGQLTVEAVSTLGYGNVLFMGGLISMGLALFNFLPVPPLDGGGMLIAFVEGLRRGKRLSPSIIRMIYVIGTALMISLFVLVFYSDIARLIRGDGFGL